MPEAVKRGPAGGLFDRGKVTIGPAEGFWGGMLSLYPLDSPMNVSETLCTHPGMDPAFRVRG